MFIQTEETPNPETLKFLPGRVLLESGSYEATNKEEAGNSPLAQRLFGIVGVQSLFITREFLSVTKAEDTDWSMLKPIILAGLMEHLSLNLPIVDAVQKPAEGQNAEVEADSEIVEQIKELLDTRVRPMVAMDGGDIVFDSFDDEYGIVYLKMQGACAGCPSSTATLKVGIENMLRHFIPEVQEVRPAQMY